MTVEKKLSAPRRRTRAEVQQLVAEFLSSGMRRSEFCRSQGLSFGTLNRHLKKQRWKRKSRAVSSAGRLVPVELAARKSPTQHEPGFAPRRFRLRLATIHPQIRTVWCRGEAVSPLSLSRGNFRLPGNVGR